MASEHLRRWRRLSLGLARHWNKPFTTARREKLVRHVADAIDMLVDEAKYEKRPITDWDGTEGGLCVTDRLNDYLWDRRLLLEGRDGEERGRLGNDISCCIRAGLDVASRPSCGVIGFTMGDLRRACDGVVPLWVRAYFEPDLLLDDLDDAEGLWL